MDSEIRRLATFVSCTASSSKFRPSVLAHSGFYYVTSILSIVCSACELKLKNFESTDEVDAQHQTASPICKFVLEKNSRKPAALRENKENDQCNYAAKGERQPCVSKIFNESKIFKNGSDFYATVKSVSDREKNAFQHVNNPTRSNLPLFSHQIGILNETDAHADESRTVSDHFSFQLPNSSLPTVPEYKVRHPEYVDQHTRWLSFQDKPNIPHYQYANPRYLSEAGFYLQGPGDNVRCFCCDGGLKNFQPNDDPWREHARWFPRCPYLCEKKDQEYIKASELPSQTEILKSRTPGNTCADSVCGADAQTVGKSYVENAAINIVKSSESSPPSTFEHDHSDTVHKEPLKINKGKSIKKSAGGAAAHVEDASVPIGNNVDNETEKLLSENGLLREARRCKVCLDKEVDTVFLPCGHLVCCNVCAPELKNCPVCRALIRGTVRVFLT